MSRNKFFIIVLEDTKTSTSFNSEVFHNQLVNFNGIIAWWHYLESMYIIKVSSSVNTSHVTNLIIELAPNKKFFTSEVRLKDYNGWLPEEAWKWINDNR